MTNYGSGIAKLPAHGIPSTPLALYVPMKVTTTGTPGNLLFRYEPPVFALRRTDQQLLSAALSGAPDRELAARLGLPLASVKKRWRSIFDAVAESRPDLFQSAGEHSGTRGPQRRHLVLTYVRDHPEELTPFAADPS